MAQSSAALDQKGGPSEASPNAIEATTTSLAQDVTRTLKHRDLFAVFDSFGDAGTRRDSPEGLYFRDTRHLSRLELTLEGRRPLLLGSVVQDDNGALICDLTNTDVRPGEADGLPRDVIALERTKFLWNGSCFERIVLRNYDAVPRRVRLEIGIGADFRDLFEIRGTRRARHGTVRASERGGDALQFVYTALDGAIRSTVVCFNPAPAVLEPHRATFEVALEPGARKAILVTADCREGRGVGPPRPHFLSAYREARRSRRREAQAMTTVRSSNALFNEVIDRAASDLSMLVTPTEHGPYPYAGVPWYSTVFGRDGILTAYLLLWANPSLARGVLAFLAANQADAVDPASDAEPGKILHETRDGEMARLKEVPFRRYYGSVDSTPLFLLLAGAYYERTADRALIEAIWPNIRAALAWCDQYGDPDGDGFVEYHRATEKGLANQGWKDSHDAIFHADGSMARGPIALCEVQGYVFAAKRHAARLARVMGDYDLGNRLEAEAGVLRERFEATFWCEELGTYAIALDGEKRPCKVRSSNAGHLLMTGIAAPDRAARVAANLLSPAGFSGWGIRTIAQGEARYNPMSYHNGSVWPHDNALIALGFARYGLRGAVARVLTGLFDTAVYQELRRLPELHCGFNRRRARGPVAYPVACAPQAWAAAAPFALVGACLGLELDRLSDEVRLVDPALPPFLDEIVIRGLSLGATTLDLRVHRHETDVTVNVLRRVGPARVILAK